MNRITVWLLCLIFIFLRVTEAEICIAQDVDLKTDVKFVDASGDLISKVKAIWYHQGKSKELFAPKGQEMIGSGDGLIVAHAAGYDYSGQLLGNEPTASIIVKLRKQNEASTTYKPQSLPFSAEQKKKVLADIKQHFWQQIKSKPKNPQVLQQSVFPLAKLSPKKTIEYFEANPLKGRLNGLVKSEIIRAIASSDFATAAQIADSINNPFFRATLFKMLLDFGPKDLPNTKRSAIETEWANSIKRIKQPAMRLGLWSVLAGYYLETDRSELAKKIVDQHRAEIEKLSPGGHSGFSKSLFAAVVAVNDPDRAVELVEGTEKMELNRAHDRIAFYCCRAHPDKALELAEGDRKFFGSQHRVKICRRMAIEQPDAAFKLADSIEDQDRRTWAFGLIALQLHESNPTRANEALQKAIEAISETEEQNKFPHTSSSPTNTLAGLLPIASKIAPEKMEAMIWQTIYFAFTRYHGNLGGESKLFRIQTTAAQISRYDRSIANALAGVPKVEIGNVDSGARTVANQVALNFDGLPDLLKRLDQVEDNERFRHRKDVVELLTGSEEEFWDSISKPKYLKWPTGNFEDYPGS